MNPVLILSHNTLALTKRCVESVRAQDVRVVTLVVDNGSTDGTQDWLESQPYPYEEFYSSCESSNTGVSKGWNWGLDHFFNNRVESPDHVLVLNSDTVLPSFFYRYLLGQDSLFVTGTSVGTMEEMAVKPNAIMIAETPDFSAYCIWREAWERIGPFDEDMRLYASDLDYNLRGWRQGIHMHRANVNFYHERSSTLRLASPKNRRLIELQADADRETFYRKWGFPTWSPEYAKAFSPETFGVDHPMVKEINNQ